MIYPLFGKRLKDLLVASAALPIVLPILAIVWIVHRLIVPWGFLFRQQRVGHGGKPFTIYKIQTMDVDGTTTGFTRFLRRSSIDELPQIANVINGKMGFVGPRPEMVCKATEHGFIDHPRNLVRPGLSGPVQISAARKGEIVDSLDLDAAYVDEVSFIKDIEIMLRTPLALVRSDTD